MTQPDGHLVPVRNRMSAHNPYTILQHLDEIVYRNHQMRGRRANSPWITEIS
ncbi:hypothetical protein GCM10025857_09660 [Alicyclobacillus contaminans]|nr:hypothetical protein GCM10025857_09660 [Alicyclobacillus contaminans]